MRISDWSSDVCSSDLDRGFEAVFAIGDAVDRDDLRPIDDIGAKGGAVPQDAPRDAVLVDGQAERMGEVIALRRRHARLVIGVRRVAPDEPELGRAEGRERGCPYL